MTDLENMDGWTRVKAWLTRLAPSTQYKALRALDNFMKWSRENGEKFSDMTPDELIDYQFNADRAAQYEILDTLVQPYVLSIEGRVGYKQKLYSTIRSLFFHSRAELPRDPGFNLGVTREKVRGRLEPEHIRDMVLSSKPVYQAVFLSMFQGGLGLAELKYWNLNGWGNLIEQLDQDKQIIKIELPGRKKAKNVRPYHTYIGGDAVDAVKNWVQHRPQNAKAIFTNRFGEPISSNALQMYWIRHLRKLGLAPESKGMKHTRTGRNLHELRDTFRTQWAKSGANPDIGEYCLGHDIDPLEYNKCFTDEEYTVEEYRAAMPMLQVMSSPTPYRLVRENVVQQLRSDLEKARQDRDDRVSELEKQIEDLAPLLELVKSREFYELLKKRES